MTQIILPDSPSSVMQLFDADKQALIAFAASIINSVNDGHENALKVQVLLKKQEFVLEKIKEGIKEPLKTEAVKYGEKEFDYAGTKCHYTPTATSYDFSGCGDHQLNELEAQMESLKKEIEDRKTFLKSLNGHTTFLDKTTGEVESVNPPIKKQSYGVKVTLK